MERNNETLIHKWTEEDMLITPIQVKKILANHFNVKGEKQSGLEKAICDQYNCSSRTARKAIKEAVKMEMVNKQKKGRSNIISVNKNTGKGK